MASVPITFFPIGYVSSRELYQWFTWSMFDLPNTQGWRLAYNYRDLSGVVHKASVGSGASYAPITVSPSLNSIAAGSQPSPSPYIDATVTFPDEWRDVRMMLIAGISGTFGSVGFWQASVGLGTRHWSPGIGDIDNPDLVSAPAPKAYIRLTQFNPPPQPPNNFVRSDVNNLRGLSLTEWPLPAAYYGSLYIPNTSRHEQTVSFEVWIEFSDGQLEHKSGSVTIPGATRGFITSGFEGDSSTRYFIRNGVAEIQLLYNQIEGWEAFTGTGFVRLKNRSFDRNYQEEGGSPAKWSIEFGNGIVSSWRSAPNIKPIAVFDTDGDWEENRWVVEQKVKADGTKSFDVDGTIVKYEWIFAEWVNGFFQYATYESTSPTIDHTYQSGATHGHIQLTVTDNKGASSFAVVSVEIAESSDNVIFGSVMDNTNLLTTAVNDGENVTVSQFKGGAATREILSTIENAKNPSLARNPFDNTIKLTYEDRETNNQMIAFSIDGGKTWL